jgi:hypothetical protein
MTTGDGQREEPAVCRWLTYIGSPVLVEDLLYRPQNSLIA